MIFSILSKIEADKLDLRLDYINTISFFSDLTKIFSSEIKQKGLNFFFDISPDVPGYLNIDELRLRQIVVNILGNAIKFTSIGDIHFKVWTTPCMSLSQSLTVNKNVVDLYITIEDTGIGIKKEFIREIFNPFSQQEKQDNSKYGGTGLGLAICERLVKLMNGTIELESGTR